MRFVKSIGTIVLWCFVISLSFYFFLDNVIAFFYGYRSRNFGSTLFNNQFWVVMHLVGGTMALLLGPLQFWPAIRTRFMTFHRLSGKIYMLGVFLIGISSLRLSLVSYCVPCRVSLFILTVLVLLSTFFAWKAIKVRNIKVHRQMMVRSYICVLAFVAVRLDDIMPLDFIFGNIKDSLFRRTVNEYFFSFVPLIVAEILMVWIPSVYLKSKRKLMGIDQNPK